MGGKEEPTFEEVQKEKIQSAMDAVAGLINTPEGERTGDQYKRAFDGFQQLTGFSRSEAPKDEQV